MKIGALFPQFEIGLDPVSIRDFSQAADDLGYTHLTSFDQIIGLNKKSRPDWKYVHDAEDMFHEIFVLFGYLAAVTTRIEFVTGILVLPMRGTALVAKQAAEVDVLSNGRLRLGIGVGVKPEEFEACGEDFGNRGKRVDEQIDVLRKLWTSDLITYEGEYHRIEDGGINPLPIQRPIPIWIGGISKAAIRRTAQLGDGWLPNFQADDLGKRSIDAMREMAVSYGRDPDTIGIEATMTIIDRTPEELRTEIDDWRRIGATHITINTMPERWVEEEKRWNKAAIGGLANPQAHIDAVRAFHANFPELF
ncbi:LLM class F420-dependent oxidoreductase [Bauldia litoralis]|uniref:Probable F420-dependent oxidoreductase, Rv2161c family n=1 Tax=Bauldia litoralis TaxID=665467 RepID=A0A1G6BAN3_9HYPH|nr:LLM class F420-dependent oxidoreductase [Bauldia litoralis]SDB17668.1 probable F420-dependent oxidoreductase, Rv2161c family [Bauldia litoralis]